MSFLFLLLSLRFAVPYRILLLTLSKVRDTLAGIIIHLAVHDNGLRLGRGVKNKILCKKSNSFDFLNLRLLILN